MPRKGVAPFRGSANLPEIVLSDRGYCIEKNATPYRSLRARSAPASVRESVSKKSGLCPEVSREVPLGPDLKVWKATKEYLNQRGTKIRVFRVCFRTPFLPPFSPHFSPPLSPSGPVHSCTTSPLFTSPFIPPLLAPGKVRFRYPSDLGTL